MEHKRYTNTVAAGHPALSVPQVPSCSPRGAGAGVGVGMLRGRWIPLSVWVSWFLGFLVSWFLSFLVAWFYGSKVSWFLGFLVSKFQSFKESQVPFHFLYWFHIAKCRCHDFQKILIPYSRFQEFLRWICMICRRSSSPKSSNMISHLEIIRDCFLDYVEYPGVSKDK